MVSICPVNFLNINTFKRQKDSVPKFKEIKSDTFTHSVSFGCSKVDISGIDLDKCEEFQSGIKVFDGLSMKQIVFALDNLYTIMAKRGCNNHCISCFASAEVPLKEDENHINSMCFEDFSDLINGVRELKERMGIYPWRNVNKDKNIFLFHDSDGMDVLLKDKNGQSHDFTELGHMIKKKWNRKVIFDTEGWNLSNNLAQKRAEKYVNYYLNPSNVCELDHINISINTFHPSYVKSVDKLRDGDVEKANALRNIYVNRMANVLFTMTPLLDSVKMNFLVRAFDSRHEKLKGFTVDDLKSLYSDIGDKLTQMYLSDLSEEQKTVKSSDDIMRNMQRYNSMFANSLSTRIIFSKKLGEYCKKSGIDVKSTDFPKDLNIKSKRDYFFEIYKSASRKLFYSECAGEYLNYIDANGKLYIGDNYRMIPTDIQFDFENKDKLTAAFTPEHEDYKITSDML